MARDDERVSRSEQEPIVGGLPSAPGILAAIRLTPGLGVHLRGLADELLVKDYPGATLTRAEREMLATAVSAANDCFYCMDSHGAFARELLERSGLADVASLIASIKRGTVDRRPHCGRVLDVQPDRGGLSGQDTVQRRSVSCPGDRDRRAGLQRPADLTRKLVTNALPPRRTRRCRPSSRAPARFCFSPQARSRRRRAAALSSPKTGTGSHA